LGVRGNFVLGWLLFGLLVELFALSNEAGDCPEICDPGNKGSRNLCMKPLLSRRREDAK